MTTFQGTGRWLGCAEVYAGDGRFLGNGTDTRQVQDVGEGRVRIDVAFIGPLKAAGHYFIQDNGDHRVYLGPINVGYAETLSANLVDANAYWASVGLTQRFFLMVLDDIQLSLALMSRGDQLIYAIVGENQRVYDNTALPTLLNGTSYDLESDTSGGRGAILLHRAGIWRGDITTLDANRQVIGTRPYSENVAPNLEIRIEGSHFAPQQCFDVLTNGWQGWTREGETVGSYSLSGGRAMSGYFYQQASHLRVWRREVVCHDGSCKAVVHHWYRGNERVGIEYGVLHYHE
jgi:hypothetical protein